ncbi:MAG TPA: hypothetical protein VFZ59_20105 [Verrucomicrobiae bacterium]|nr:hypothetical protein [Verrucomicrobiae bacterium]
MKARRRVLAAAALLAGLLGVFLLRQPGEVGGLKLPSGATKPIISLGDSHGIVLAPDGTLWSWGGEDRGFPVLGLGQTNYTPRLIRINADTNWISVSAGDAHNLALKADGTIWAWGGNFRGQLGDGNGPRLTNALMRSRNQPTPTVEGNDWVAVEAGFSTSYALKKDGTLWAWGLNNFSQLGNGTWTESSKPVQVGMAAKWVKIKAGGVSAAGMQSDGRLWIWGGSPKFGNTKSQSSENYLEPQLISTETNWVDFDVAFNIWLAVKADGTLWAWGRVAHIFTGAPETSADIPVQIGTNTDWRCVSSSRGGSMHLLQKRDDSFWVMDAPTYDHASVRFRQIELPHNIVAFDLGGGAVAAMTKDGEVWTWGTVLGYHSPKDRFMRTLAGLCWRLGWKVSWGVNQTPVTRQEPWRLRTLDQDDQNRSD